MTDNDILPPADAQAATATTLDDTGEICNCLFDVFGLMENDVFVTHQLGDAIEYLSDIDRRLEKALIETNSDNADPVAVAEYVSTAHDDSLKLKQLMLERYDDEVLDEPRECITTPRCDTLRELLDTLRDDVLQARLGVTMWKQLTR